MKNLLKIASICFMVICFYQGKAQIPFNDPAWQLQTSYSDYFNESSLNTTLWDSLYYGTSHISNGAEWNLNSDLIFTGSYLKIRGDTLIPNKDSTPVTHWDNSFPYTVTYAYRGGAITSNENFPWHCGTYIIISVIFNCQPNILQVIMLTGQLSGFGRDAMIVVALQIAGTMKLILVKAGVLAQKMAMKWAAVCILTLQVIQWIILLLIQFRRVF